MDLSGNKFYHLTTDVFVKIFQAIPKTVTCLNLSAIQIYRMPGEAFKNLPKNITSLILSNNCALELVTGLIKHFPFLPEHDMSLDLSNNNLDTLMVSTLTALFRSIPPNITSLRLCKNNLDKFMLKDLAKIFAAIPLTVRTIDLGYNDLFLGKTTVQKNDILNALGNERARFNLAGNGESDLARALVTMPAIQKQYKLPNDITSHVLSFLKADSFYQSALGFFTFQLQKTEEKIKSFKKIKYAP